MTSRADICKRHAADCDRRALLSADEDIRRQDLDLAKQWREMVDQLKAIERLRQSGKRE